MVNITVEPSSKKIKKKINEITKRTSSLTVEGMSTFTEDGIYSEIAILTPKKLLKSTGKMCDVWNGRSFY